MLVLNKEYIGRQEYIELLAYLPKLFFFFLKLSEWSSALPLQTYIFKINITIPIPSLPPWIFECTWFNHLLSSDRDKLSSPCSLECIFLYHCYSLESSHVFIFANMSFFKATSLYSSTPSLRRFFLSIHHRSSPPRKWTILHLLRPHILIYHLLGFHLLIYLLYKRTIDVHNMKLRQHFIETLPLANCWQPPESLGCSHCFS